jgi:hypothetical protein
VRRHPAVILSGELRSALLVPMRNFFLGVVVGLLLAVASCPLLHGRTAEDSSRADAVAPAFCWRTG